MGGVDKFDQIIKYYPLKRKSNRWTQQFSMHVFELLLHNSYVLYKKYRKGKFLSHYDFIQAIIRYLIRRGTEKNKYIVKDTTLDRSIHLPYKASKRNPCINCCNTNSKISTTGVVCTKCGTYVCISPCFYDYHISLHEDLYESNIYD
ncbi:PiggyBac transposable element-derived protein 4 [Dictyocoela muelleri]|nr:PiggyBac transposable element-derived protein 4 [Dictyocoela muelleri]